MRFSDALYLIFKLAVALWQSFDHDIRSVRRVQGTYKEQTLTDLKFVLGHNVVALHKKYVASARFYRKHTRQATAGRASLVCDLDHDRRLSGMRHPLVQAGRRTVGIGAMLAANGETSTSRCCGVRCRKR